MKKYLLSLLCLVACSMTQGAPLPVEELSHGEAYGNFQLSPDGKFLIYAETVQGTNVLKIVDLTTGKKMGLDVTRDKKAWFPQMKAAWLSNERLIYSNGFLRYDTINRDGSKSRSMKGDGAFNLGQILHIFRNNPEGLMLTAALDVTTDEGTSYTHYTYQTTRPGVAKVNTSLGVAMLREKNPGNIVTWLITPEGEIPAAYEIDGTRYRVVWRESEKSSFRALPGMDWDDPQVLPLGFGENNRVLYVSRLNAKGYWAVYPYDLRAQTFGQVILEQDGYDIIPQSDASGQTGLIYSPDEKQLLGIRYLTDYPQVLWLDAGLAEVQAALDQALPGKVNTITSMSDDLQQLTVLSWSDRDPGTNYIFDRTKPSLSELMKTMPWIKPEQMSPMRPVKYQSRDGLMIHGYVTVPVGVKPRNLPLIVLINGSYWSRATWGFDTTTQFLANRGYAVMEVSPRGSSGYGDLFKKAGYRNTEKSLQDISDGVKWAIDQGLVDAKRVAIVGDRGMSGIQGLTALALDRELYACGVVNSPYTDWRQVIHRDNFNHDYLNLMKERLGDPNDSADRLSEISPVQLVDRIKAPLLITHTENFKPWHYIYTKKMVAALQDAGKDVTFKTSYNKKIGFQNYGTWLEDAAAFLAAHMPAK